MRQKTVCVHQRLKIKGKYDTGIQGYCTLVYFKLENSFNINSIFKNAFQIIDKFAFLAI